MNITVNWGLLAPILAIQLILMVTALTSLYKADATRGPKWMWVLIIVFGQILGPIIYFVVGRNDRS
ncbi:PLD nuclease N-terminal domain-containing protein [Paenibacillus terrigena]|uniref:PLD nuclease N-terminal domain-containing protein n=1 Tax=Paenibacillus terrigena TaxID=369333 RepID=UPI000362407D|nr:PLD nuclease N-terminal domain-containing protein [Paenibacillus terrigena]